jgi:hypothetical protein
MLTYQCKSVAEQVVEAALAQKDMDLQAERSKVIRKESAVSQLKAEIRTIYAAQQPELARSKASLQAQIALTRTTEQRLTAMEKLLSERDAELAVKSQEVRLLTLSQPVEGSHKRARSDLQSSSGRALDRDDICDMVLGYVGPGEHLYIGLISRRYRGRYMQLCKAAEKKRAPGPKLSRDTKLLRTSCAAAMQSAARLQLAFDAGLTDLHFAQKQPFHGYIQWLTTTCIDPIAALAIARVYGVPWTADITTCAAAAAKLELLQWCVTSRCPLDADAALTAAAKGGDVLTVEWLVQQLADLVDCSQLYDACW